MQKHMVFKAITAILFVTFMMIGITGKSTLAYAASTKPITVVWYPNESSNDHASSRAEFGKLIGQATGRKVEHRLTTDYVIAIEALASGAADIGAVMGAVGYIEARNKNPKVDVLFVNSGVSGTLDDAIYYSWLIVNKNDADKYKDGDKYSIANIQGKKMSFVSNSSTSGFRVPTSGIIGFFSKTEQWKNINADDLLGLGSKVFFREVLFGGSHQGSAFNLLSGRADISAVCDYEMNPYVAIKDGEENKVGSVYAVRANAPAPFNTVTGKEFVLIYIAPVLNGPNAYNPQNLSPKEIQAIRDIFTSDKTANNPNFFAAPGSGSFAFYKKTKNERYVLVNDSWYNPIREMGK